MARISSRPPTTAEVTSGRFARCASTMLSPPGRRRHGLASEASTNASLAILVLRLHEADGGQDLLHPRLLLLQEVGEGVAGEIGVVPALLLQDFLPGRRLRHL